MNGLLNFIYNDFYNKLNNTAIIEKGMHITYQDIIFNVEKIRDKFLKDKFIKDERIGICLDNSPDFIYVFLAVLSINCIPVLISPTNKIDKIQYIIEDSGITGFIGSYNVFNKIKIDTTSLKIAVVNNNSNINIKLEKFVLDDYNNCQINNNIETILKKYGLKAEDFNKTTLIIYTSGSTGLPKGVMLSAQNIIFAVNTIIRELNIIPNDISLVSINFNHCAGLLHILANIKSESKLVVGENTTLVGSLLTAVKKYKVTILPGVPSFFEIIFNYGDRVKEYFESLRIIELSSAMPSIKLIKIIKEHMPKVAIYNTYGLTEAPRCTYCKITTSSDTIPIGKAMPKVNITLYNNEMKICNENEDGEIYLSGVNIANGYWKKTEKTQERFTSLGFKTGDIGYHSNGLFFFKGRIDDMIKVGAEKVYPFEVEEAISQIKGVKNVLVYGIDDPIYGSVCVANIVRQDNNLSKKDIKTFCRTKLERYKIPAKINFCDKIELEDSGKPKRVNK